MTTQFTLIPSRYEDVVPFLKKEAPEFLAAPEYSIHGAMIETLPSVFAAAFAAYVSRIAATTPTDERLAGYLAAIGTLADWNDSAVDEALRDDIFETIHSCPEAEAILGPRLAGRAALMYNDWLAGWPRVEQ